jgi:hypothetical protein
LQQAGEKNYRKRRIADEPPSHRLGCAPGRRTHRRSQRPQVADSAPARACSIQIEAATRALRIRERLGSKGGIDDPFPEKPKGMRWKSYHRLRAREARLQRRWALGITSLFHRAGGDR